MQEKWKRRFDPFERYGLRLTLLTVAATLVAVPFGLVMHQVVTAGPLTRLDTALARRLQPLARNDRTLEITLEFVSFLGKPIWLLFVVGVPAVWLARRGSWNLAVFLAATTASAGVVVTIVKLAVGRPRPDVATSLTEAFGNSFPSGHSTSSLVCYGALLLAFLPAIPRRLRPLAFVCTALLVLAIGLSRLGLGVHFLSDVVGGYVLGLGWLIGATAVFNLWRSERGRPDVDLTEGVEPEDVPADLRAEDESDHHEGQNPVLR